jgi:hypothetical protein
MSLKTKVQNRLCNLKNGEYKILSQKIRSIDIIFKEEIELSTEFLNELKPTITDRVRYILQKRQEVNRCGHCDTPILSLHKVYCSKKCSNNSEQTKNKFRERYDSLSKKEKQERNQKRTETVKERYGGYTLENTELVKKVRTTMVERYGVEHSFQSSILRNKAIGTWMSKYGTDNPFKSNLIKDKIIDVLTKKYGVTNASNIDSEKRIEKVMKTKIERGWVIPDEFLSDYQLYRKKVKRLTEKTYKEYKHKINPNNFERVTNGKSGHQLDHKYSILEGFLNDVEPEIVSHHCNLQMLEWEINRTKSKRCDIELQELIKEIKSYE